jgi:hypothetical protein
VTNDEIGNRLWIAFGCTDTKEIVIVDFELTEEQRMIHEMGTAEHRTETI